MNVLLLVTGRALPVSVVDDARRELADDSLVVDVVTWLPPVEALDEAVGTCVVIGPVRAVPTSGGTSPPVSRTAPGPSTPTAQAAPARSPWVRTLRRPFGRARRRIGRTVRRLVVGGVSRQFWTRIRRDGEASTVAARADVIVAMDTGAIRAGWHLARRHPAAVVTLGLAAAAREVEQRG